MTKTILTLLGKMHRIRLTMVLLYSVMLKAWRGYGVQGLASNHNDR